MTRNEKEKVHRRQLQFTKCRRNENYIKQKSQFYEEEFETSITLQHPNKKSHRNKEGFETSMTVKQCNGLRHEKY